MLTHLPSPQSCARCWGTSARNAFGIRHSSRNKVKIKDKTVSEKLQLIDQLEDEDKQAVYRIIDGMLTKSKFKDFFQKNVAAL